MRRVVVTGMGIVSPLGCGVDLNWKKLTAGQSGLRKVTRFPVDDIASHIAGVVPYLSEEPETEGAFNPDDVLPPKDHKKVDTFILYALGAAKEALDDANWHPETEEDRCRTGVMIGAGIGGLESIYETSVTLFDKGPRRVSPFAVPSMLINLASGHVSIQHGLKGPNHSVVTACASGAHAIGDAARLIMWDDADVMLAGGAEAGVNRLGMAAFAACRALSTGYNDNPTAGSRPFDDGRDGFVIAEGSGLLVLEEYEHAKKRGAKIYAEIIGYGMSGDAYHMTSPAEDGNGGYRAMDMALKRAGIKPADIDYINAHGTSTPMGDGIECGAVKRLFGDDIKNVAMSSTKSAIGHLLGAAGAVEAIYAIKAIQTGVIPPTLNLDNPSEACQGINLVPNVAQAKKVRTVLSNSFGFGGTNASLVIRAV
ncbi:MAG: beta-ketoacyl-ACP synthase II [Pseudomonadota bacterium]